MRCFQAGWWNFQRSSPAGYEHLKAGMVVVDGKLLSGSRDGSGPGGGLVIERGKDVANADDADQAVVVDHGQMADVVLVHEMASVFERIGRTAGHQLLYRDQLRNFQIDAGRAVFGN